MVDGSATRLRGSVATVQQPSASRVTVRRPLARSPHINHGLMESHVKIEHRSSASEQLIATTASTPSDAANTLNKPQSLQRFSNFTLDKLCIKKTKMPLTQGAKVLLGAGAVLGGAYLFSRRSATAGYAEQGFQRQAAYEPRYGRLPKTNGAPVGMSTNGNVRPTEPYGGSGGYSGIGVAPPIQPGQASQLEVTRADEERLAVRPMPPPLPGSSGYRDAPKRPAEYVEQAGLVDRSASATRTGAGGQAPGASGGGGGGLGIVDRVSEVKDVVKEHAKAAAEDVSQAASEVGRVVSEHARQARRDVSGAASEVSTALTDRRPLPEVRVKDTPDLVHPEAGKGIEGAERRVPTAVGTRSGVTQSEIRQTEGVRDTVGGGWERGKERGKERVREDVDRVRERVGGEWERGKERAREDANRARDAISSTGERIREQGEYAVDKVAEGVGRAAGAVRGAAEEAADAVRSIGHRARDDAREVCNLRMTANVCVVLCVDGGTNYDSMPWLDLHQWQCHIRALCSCARARSRRWSKASSRRRIA